MPGGGWHVVADGELWLASRFPAKLVQEFPERGFDADRDVADRYVIYTAAGPIDFYNLHLTSPHGVFSDTLHLRPGAAAPLQSNIQNRFREAVQVAASVRAVAGPVVLAGDFNLPSDSAAFGQTFSPFDDAFGEVGFGFGWTYRVRWTTTRIDHILSTGGIIAPLLGGAKCRLAAPAAYCGPGVGSGVTYRRGPFAGDFSSQETDCHPLRLMFPARSGGVHLLSEFCPSQATRLLRKFPPMSPILILLIDIAVVLMLSRLLGMAMRLLHQPQVVGEMIAGIMLGPSLLGLIHHGAWMNALFPQATLGNLNVLSQLGVMLFMFLVGLELDPKLLRGQGRAALVTGTVGILIPFLFGGAALALLLIRNPAGHHRRRRTARWCCVCSWARP